MAIGSADNDIIDCTDIAEFYCWPAFLSRSCGPHGPFHLAGDDVDDRLSRETRKTRGLTVRWKREHEPTDRPRIDQRRSGQRIGDHAFVDRGKSRMVHPWPLRTRSLSVA